MPKTYRNVTYWPTYEEARTIARQHGYGQEGSTIRIIRYDRGWAIQKHKSGPYLDLATGGFGA